MSPLRSPSPLLLLLGCALALLPVLAGCSDDATDPPADPATTGGTLGSGQLDPDLLTFTLEAGTTAPDGATYVPVQLVGRNLTVLADSNRISLEVALRNAHSDPLYAPGAVFLSRFAPAGVRPIDADEIIIPQSPLGEIEYRYDYVAEFGQEGVLEPGETSGFRTWTFAMPELGAFSFAARTVFGLAPERPRIAGIAFLDRNADGVYNRGDAPLGAGLVWMASATDTTEHWFDDPRGRFSIPIERPGLYTLRFDPLIDTIYFVPWYFTTPYPLNVLIPADAEGRPVSYLGANFGVAWPTWTAPEPIGFTDAPVDSLHRAPWTLIEVEAQARGVLRLRAGFSGCDAEQPASLWASGGFMESEPVQIAVVFVNESLDECDAWFENDFLFDLTPLWDRYLAAYGPGVLQMNLVDFQGDVHVVEIPIFPED